jgi:hypothetical protein
MLPQTYLCLWVRCRGGCQHGRAADLQAIIDAGQGDRPLKDLRFRCAKCGSRRTDFVVMSRDATRVQPWRTEEVGGRRGAADKRSGVLRLKANDLVRHSLHRCGCYWRSQRRLSFCCWRTHRALHRYACFYPLPRGIDGAFCGGPQQAFDHLPRAHRVSAYVAGRIDLGSRQRWIAVAAGGPSLRRSPRTFC